MRALKSKFVLCRQREATIPEGAILTTMLATRNFSTGSAGSGSSSGSSSNSQNSQTGASPSSPAAAYLGNVNSTATPPAPASRHHDSSSTESGVRRVGAGGYVQLVPAECSDPEDGKKSTNAGKIEGVAKKKSTKDEDACSMLKRCSLL